MTKSKSVLPFKFATPRLLLLYIIIMYIASQGLRNGKGAGSWGRQVCARHSGLTLEGTLRHVQEINAREQVLVS